LPKHQFIVREGVANRGEIPYLIILNLKKICETTDNSIP